MDVIFLGTGGGRFCTIRQLRKTGGLFLNLDNFKMFIDPGPGALVNSREQKIDLEKLDALLVTHGHTDHCNDAEILIEAMTSGGTKKRGVLITNSTVINGLKSKNGNFDPRISSYHLNLLKKVIIPEENEKINLGKLELEFIKTRHPDPNTLAFKMNKNNIKIGFITDTIYFEKLISFFKDCKILFINLLRPRSKPWKGHLSTEDALKILNNIKPDLAIFHHFGMAMIYSSIKKEELWLRKNLKVNCEIIFAKDFQKINLDKRDKEVKNLKTFFK